MSLSNALFNSYSGLAAATKQADVTATNIANATTEGYARREVRLADQVVGDDGGGVRVAGVNLAEVETLTADRRRAGATLGQQSAIADAYDVLAGAVGAVDDPSALFTRYQDFETSIRELADTPESTAAQTAVLNRAVDVATAFNDIQDRLETLRQDTDTEIARQVDVVNAALIQIEDLNVRIAEQTTRGGDSSVLIQQRQNEIDKISTIIPVKVIDRDQSRVAVTTAAGATLIDGPAQQLEFSATPVVTPDMDLRNGAGPLSGLTLNGRDVTPGVSSANLFGGGSLAGLFEVRDGVTVEFQTQIDSLAEDLINRFSDPAVDGTLGGGPGVFTFDASLGAVIGDPGLAGRIEVNPAVDPAQSGEVYRLRDGIGATAPGEAGDNRIPIAMLAALTDADTVPADSGLSGVRSASALIADYTSLVSTNAQTSAETQAMRAASFNALDGAEKAAIGVDIDFELQNLTLIQTAYSANARVLQTVDEMLRTLLEI